MKTTKSIFYLLNLFIVLALFSGCGGNPVENKMYGTWEISDSLSNSDFRKLSKEPLPDELKIEMAMEGTHSYHKGGKYNEEGEVTVRLKTSEGEIPLRLFMRDSGEWSLHANGEELVETTTEGILTPLDELTKEFLKESPEIARLLKPIKGETITYRILSITDTTMKIQEDESKFKLSMSKKR